MIINKIEQHTFESVPIIYMYISEFHIKNFKSFEDVTVHFNEKINIFTGVNNAGKSTMLEAISLWHECYNRLIHRASKSVRKLYNIRDFVFSIEKGWYVVYTDIVSIRSPGYSDIFYKLDENKTIEIIATLKVGDRDLKIGFFISKAEGGNNYKVGLCHYRDFNYRLFNDTGFIKNPEADINVFYASPLANILSKEERQHSLKIDYLKRAHTTQVAFRNRIETLFQRRNETGNPYDTFRNQLSNIILGTDGQIDFEFRNHSNLEINLKIKIGAEIPKDVSLVGSGTLQIMEILLNIHEQKKELKIILLDEPDSHIHRQLQSRLLSVLNASDNTQIFITTHNESMIREAQSDWIFHLEKQPKKEYYSIQRNTTTKPIGLLSSAKSPVIQTLAGIGNSLDFITALEADVLFMVEGVNDALRIQKILSLKSNDLRKYAYWIMGNVDTIFEQLAHYKNVFSLIKNDKTLWEKTILIFDKDFLTDLQRERLLEAIKTKLNLKQVYCWESYNFDSTLFSNLSYLTAILQRWIRVNSPNLDISDLPNKLDLAMGKLVAEKGEEFKPEKITTIINKIHGELNKRRGKFEISLGSRNNVIDEEFHLNTSIVYYLKSSCNVQDLHKIMTKDDCQKVLQEVFSSYNIDFQMEGDRGKGLILNDLFDVINLSTRYADWDFILKV